MEARPQVRPLTRGEIEAFFDHADEQVTVRARQGRKGWAAAWRDATLFKMIYAFGLRHREAAMLDLVDFGSNPKAPEFGKFGLVAVRWGRASKGSPLRRRTVLTVMPWSPQVLDEYVQRVRPLYGTAAGPVLWPTEPDGRIGVDHVSRRFAEYRDQIGLPAELHPYCLLHSYMTLPAALLHDALVEDGYDPLFVQQQIGHAWGSRTALDTSSMSPVPLPSPGQLATKPANPSTSATNYRTGAASARRASTTWSVRCSGRGSRPALRSSSSCSTRKRARSSSQSSSDAGRIGTPGTGARSAPAGRAS